MKDSAQRTEVSQKAVREKWDTQRIRQEVKRINQLTRTGAEPSRRLIAKPGIPYTYRVVPGVEEGERVIDLGFSNYYTPVGKFSFKEGDIIAVKEKGTGAIFSRSGQSPDDLYTYEARVLNVIDGDTIKAVVDLGFGFRTVQTLRLRGVDCPEIATKDGVEAKEFLESVIAGPTGTVLSGRTVPNVLIRTTKSDKYDRYLADIFINDTYVNQKLVDEGHAVRVHD